MFLPLKILFHASTISARKSACTFFKRDSLTIPFFSPSSFLLLLNLIFLMNSWTHSFPKLHVPSPSHMPSLPPAISLLSRCLLSLSPPLPSVSSFSSFPHHRSSFLNHYSSAIIALLLHLFSLTTISTPSKTISASSNITSLHQGLILRQRHVKGNK